MTDDERAIRDVVAKWMAATKTADMTPAGGKPTRREGWTLTILNCGGDGRWRVSRDANLMAAHG